MHNDLAWSVLGVDPEIHKNIEHLASKRGVSIGRFLELMIHSVSINEARDLKTRKQLSGLVAEMADCLMEAVDLLDESDAVTRSAQKTQTPPGVPQTDVPPPKSDPLAGKKEEERNPSKLVQFGTGFLRRTA